MVAGTGGVRGTSKGVVASDGERHPCVWAGAGQSWGQFRQEPGKIYITKGIFQEDHGISSDTHPSELEV